MQKAQEHFFFISSPEDAVLFIFLVNRRITHVINVPDGDTPRVSRGDKHPRISLSKGKEILILSPAAIYGRHRVSGLNAIHKSTGIAERSSQLAAHSFQFLSLRPRRQRANRFIVQQSMSPNAI